MAKYYAIACFYEKNSVYLFKNKNGKWEYPIVEFDPDSNFRHMESDEKLREELMNSLGISVFFDKIKPSEIYTGYKDERYIFEVYRFDYIKLTEYSFKKKYSECKLVPLEKLENTRDMESFHVVINKELAAIYRNDWYPKKAIMSPNNGLAYCFNNVAFRKLYETWLDLEEVRTNKPRVKLRDEFTISVKTSDSNLKKWLNGKGSPADFETIDLINKTFTENIPPYELYNKAKCSWASLLYDPNNRAEVKVYREPSGDMLRAFEAIVKAFDIAEFTWLRDETFNGNALLDDNNEYKIYFSLPIQKELLEHEYDIIIVLDLFYKKNSDGNYYGAGIREFLNISYGGDRKYIHNSELKNINVEAWHDKLKQIVTFCESGIDRCNERTDEAIHSYQLEDIRDEYNYYSLCKVRNKIREYFGSEE